MICAVVYDGEGYREIQCSGESLAEVEEELSDGLELDIARTLAGYFGEDANRYRVEVENSEYIYFVDFTELLNGGFSEYIEALDSGDYEDVKKMNRMIYE